MNANAGKPLPPPQELTFRGRVAACVELTKPRITSLVVFTTLVGFVSATRGPVSVRGALVALLGTALVAAGASALNMVLERESDALMMRTRNRPLPSGRMSLREATVFGSILTASGLGILAVGSGPLAAAIALATWVIYLFAYTPLKRVSTLATLVGAVPGALPPLIGWAAARGTLDWGSWLLFAILFVWQVPHFLAIAWLYRDDYRLGGLRTLSVVDPEGKLSGRQAVTYSMALGPISLLPPLFGLTGLPYLAGALLLGLGLGVASIRFAFLRTEGSARHLFVASVFYLAVLSALLIADRVA